MTGRKMFKVISPVEKDGKTVAWNRCGTAFINRDESINVYLETLPLSGQLQLREWTERDSKHGRSSEAGGTDVTAALQASMGMKPTTHATDDVQF